MRYNGEVCIVADMEHKTPPRMASYVQMSIRSIATKKVFNLRLTSNDSLDGVNLERIPHEYSYKDNGGYHFLHPDTYEDVVVQEDLVDPARNLEVGLGQAAEVLGGQGQRHHGEADVDVRVVVGVLGDLGHAVDEIDGFHELVELEGPGEGVAVHLPFGDFLGVAIKFGGVDEVGHGREGVGWVSGWVIGLCRECAGMQAHNSFLPLVKCPEPGRPGTRNARTGEGKRLKGGRVLATCSLPST